MNFAAAANHAAVEAQARLVQDMWSVGSHADAMAQLGSINHMAKASELHSLLCRALPVDLVCHHLP